MELIKGNEEIDLLLPQNFQILKHIAINHGKYGFLDKYKVAKKRRKRDALKRKVTPRSVYVVTHVTENSFTITFCGLAKKPI